MDFFSFEAALLRLKSLLQVQTDKEVAEALGMDASAFNKRKARGSFPEQELRELAKERGFDPEFVFTGIDEQESRLRRDALHAAAGLLNPSRQHQSNEEDLLRVWRGCSPDVQAALLVVISKLATSQPGAGQLDLLGDVTPKAGDGPPVSTQSKRRKLL